MSHWNRSEAQFFNMYELPWRNENDLPMFHNLESRLVSRDMNSESRTYMVRIPAGWSHLEKADEAALEMFVFDGDMTGNGKRVGAGGYLAIPRGGGTLEMSSANGAHVLVFWNPELSADDYYDGEPYVTSVWREDWTQTKMPELTHGIMHKSLRWPDPTGGDRHGGPAGMIRFIVMTPGFGEARQEAHHECWEECIFLAGDLLIPQRGVHGAGTVLNNPADLKHGGLITQKGAILLLHCNHPMDVEFTCLTNGQQIADDYRDTASWLPEPAHVEWKDHSLYPLCPNSDPGYNRLETK
jgi:hypothetical protein